MGSVSLHLEAIVSDVALHKSTDSVCHSILLWSLIQSVVILCMYFAGGCRQGGAGAAAIQDAQPGPGCDRACARCHADPLAEFLQCRTLHALRGRPVGGGCSCGSLGLPV